MALNKAPWITQCTSGAYVLEGTLMSKNKSQTMVGISSFSLWRAVQNPLALKIRILWLEHLWSYERKFSATLCSSDWRCIYNKTCLFSSTFDSLKIYTMSQKRANFPFALCLSNMNRFQWKLVGMSWNKHWTKLYIKCPPEICVSTTLRNLKSEPGTSSKPWHRRTSRTDV